MGLENNGLAPKGLGTGFVSAFVGVAEGEMEADVVTKAGLESENGWEIDKSQFSD